MSAPTGAFSVNPHCRSSDCSRRSFLSLFSTAATVLAFAEVYIFASPLPLHYSLPQKPISLFRYRCSVRFRISLIFFQMPQQYPLPQEPLSLSFPPPGFFRRSQTLFSKATAVLLLQATSSTPPTLSSANFGGLSTLFSGCCPLLIASFGGNALGPG